ncbi:MAG: hypothetical protein R2883_00400 [Caldisericia bacterium]
MIKPKEKIKKHRTDQKAYSLCWHINELRGKSYTAAAACCYDFFNGQNCESRENHTGTASLKDILPMQDCDSTLPISLILGFHQHTCLRWKICCISSTVLTKTWEQFKKLPCFLTADGIATRNSMLLSPRYSKKHL